MILQREAIIKYNEQFYFFAFHFLGPTSLILIRLSVTQWAMTYLLFPAVKKLNFGPQVKSFHDTVL